MTLAGGTDLDSDLPADRNFMLGGPGSFPGFELGELRLDRLLDGERQLPLEDQGHHVDPRPGAVCRGCDWRPGRRLGDSTGSTQHEDDEFIYGGVPDRTDQAGPLTVGLGVTSTDS